MAKLVYEEFPEPKLGDSWTIHVPGVGLTITIPANDNLLPCEQGVTNHGPIDEERGRRTRPHGVKRGQPKRRLHQRNPKRT